MQTPSDPLSVACPFCDARLFRECVVAKTGERRDPHPLRVLLASGHPGLEVRCPVCYSEPGKLCRHASHKRTLNITIHSDRDVRAWARDHDYVAGLVYPLERLPTRAGGIGDQRVRRRWLLSRAQRKRDNLLSYKVRYPGGDANRYMWAMTYNELVWHVGAYSIVVKRAAAAQGAIDRLAGLAGEPRTIFVDHKT